MTRRRAGTERRYIKLFIDACLHGSIRLDLEPDERSVWYDLLLFAGKCRTEGVIQAAPGRPFPKTHIAHVLNIKDELLDSTLAKCKAEGRITEDGEGIHITHWEQYQTGYEVYKKGQEGKGEPATGQKPLKVCPECHYTIELSQATELMQLCPRCKREGKEVPLVRKGEQ
ncbi:unnamed protein product [marine sediment metagenome]|uniref:Phage replisome organiser N-terminal domain-containing protein n=1 Tax=marine sediment metagenome TaxID=412755 RepID=X1R2Q2_9ZZZZ